MSDYPLWCLDNGDAACEERFQGPFADESEAKAELETLHRGSSPPWQLRRCRRVQASEICPVFGSTRERLREILDDEASEDGLSAVDNVWARWDETIVTAPQVEADRADANLAKWLNEYFVVQAFVCEPSTKPGRP